MIPPFLNTCLPIKFCDSGLRGTKIMAKKNEKSSFNFHILYFFP